MWVELNSLLQLTQKNKFLATVLSQTIFSLANFLQKDTNMYYIK
jgi:hypothetical protein